MSALAKFFESVKLPVMPEVAIALIRTLSDEDVSTSTVRNIIAKDPVLTAKLMRLANSAQFGLSREVDSLDNAIRMVGMGQIRTLALSASMYVSFPTVPGLDRVDFWRGSMACAGYAQWLAGGAGMNRQEAWLTGMMARLGELIIVQKAPDSLAEIEKTPRLPGERWAREQALFGFNEVQITAVLAHRWNFPDTIVRGLDASAAPMATQPFCALGGIVHLAALLAEMPAAGPQALDQLPDAVVTTLALNRDWMHSRMPERGSFIDVSFL